MQDGPDERALGEPSCSQLLGSRSCAPLRSQTPALAGAPREEGTPPVRPALRRGGTAAPGPGGAGTWCAAAVIKNAPGSRSAAAQAASRRLGERGRAAWTDAPTDGRMETNRQGMSAEGRRGADSGVRETVTAGRKGQGWGAGKWSLGERERDTLPARG